MLQKKLDSLITYLKDLDSVVLSYSGGVDSSFLLKAIQVSDIKFIAVTAVSEIFAQHDQMNAREIARELGIDLRLIQTEELLIDEFVNNSPERCLFCKEELYKKLSSLASAEAIQHILDGSNADDTLDYRPGRKAAQKYNVKSPLIESGFTKTEIRELSKQLQLSTWDKPSSPCLATRFPYGQAITKEALQRVEKAENFLRTCGFREIRVRDYGSMARIEVGPDEIDEFLLPNKRKVISETLRNLGYKFISLDLEGYRSGSMNRDLEL